MVKLFNFDFDEGEVVLNKEEILTIKEFAELIRKDKGSEGDNDGRKKKYAYKQFAFIYLYCDYTSPYIERDEKERLAVCSIDAGLVTEGEPFVISPMLRAAMNKYTSMQDTYSVRVFKELKGSFKDLHDTVTSIRQQNNIILRQVNKILGKAQGEEFGAKDLNAGELISLNNALVNNQTTLIKLTTTTLETLDTIRSYERSIKEEESEGIEIHGGGSIGNRELPKKDRMKFKDNG
jgi:hypothetical protein